MMADETLAKVKVVTDEQGAIEAVDFVGDG
jgi:hypothetical protein